MNRQVLYIEHKKSNTAVFFCWKNVRSFCKALYFFSGKNGSVFALSLNILDLDIYYLISHVNE